MIRLRVVIFLLLAATIGFCNTLGEIKVEEIPAGQGINYIVRDANKAVLVVNSLIPVLSFDSNMGIIKVDNPEPGYYLVHLIPGTHILTFKAKNYLPLKQRFNIQPKNFREVRVTPARQVLDELPVNFLIDPPDAEVRIDDKGCDISKSVLLSLSGHSIAIKRNGYISVQDSIYVTEQNTLFKYTLEKPKLCVINVSTTPPDASVFIDDVKLNGSTPISDFFNSGNYIIRIEKDKFDTIEEKITILPDKTNQFQYQLNSISGQIRISAVPEVNMDVILNGKSAGKTPVTIIDLDQGYYEISVEHEFYEAKSTSITLNKNETREIEFRAEENFATLNIRTTPGATIYLNNNRISKLNDIILQPQTVRLRAEKTKCEPAELTFILRKGAKETVDIFVEELLGTLAVSVSPGDAKIELTGDAGEYYSHNGTNIFSNIPAGRYNIKVSGSGYSPLERTVTVKNGTTIQERFALEKTIELDPATYQILVKNYYDTKGEWAGTFKMGNIHRFKLEKLDPTLHRVHVEYTYNPVPRNKNGRRDTGKDYRYFDIKFTEGKPVVVKMGEFQSAKF